MQSLPFLRLSFLLLPTRVPPPHRLHRPTCPIIQGRLYRRRALPREGSGVTSTRRHNGECGRRLMHRQTERSDGPMMYLQTVWRRKSVTAGSRKQEDRKRRAVRHLPELMRKNPSTTGTGTGTGGRTSPTMIHSGGYLNHIQQTLLVLEMCDGTGP